MRCGPCKFMDIVSPLKKFIFFFQISHFLNCRVKSKQPSPIYVLSVCEMRIESFQGLRRYRPYRFMLRSVEPRTDGRTGLNTLVPGSALYKCAHNTNYNVRSSFITLSFISGLVSEESFKDYNVHQW